LVPQYPSRRQIDVAMPDLEGRNWKMMYELLHTSLVVQKMMG
jgi:hypothetical protein